MRTLDPVVVVGAGPGGTGVANRLVEAHGTAVVLLEAGSSSPATLVRDGPVRRTVDGAVGSYPRGVGVGGGAAVNGGVLSWGHPRDHDEWAASVGDDRWSWASVRRRYAASAAGVTPVVEASWGEAGRRLAAVASAHGARRVDDLSRGTPDGDQFGPFAVATGVRPRPRVSERLAVVTGVAVERLLVDRGRVGGVVLADGSERRASRVVLAAGVIGTTRLLRTAGIDTCDVTDHPGIVITFPVEARADDATVSVGARLSSPGGCDDVQLVALNRTATPATGAIVVMLAAPYSRGSVEGSSGVVETHVLDDSRDVAALVWALALVRDRLDEIGGDARAGRDGVRLDDLDDPSADWLRDNVDGVWHLCGGARIGRVADARGEVVGLPGAWVADASALPGNPRANPQLPTTVLAEVVADAISDG